MLPLTYWYLFAIPLIFGVLLSWYWFGRAIIRIIKKVLSLLKRRKDNSPAPFAPIVDFSDKDILSARDICFLAICFASTSFTAIILLILDETIVESNLMFIQYMAYALVPLYNLIGIFRSLVTRDCNLQKELIHHRYALKTYRDTDYTVRINAYMSQGLSESQAKERLAQELEKTFYSLPQSYQKDLLRQWTEERMEKEQEEKTWAWIASLQNNQQ